MVTWQVASSLVDQEHSQHFLQGNPKEDAPEHLVLANNGNGILNLALVNNQQERGLSKVSTLFI